MQIYFKIRKKCACWISRSLCYWMLPTDNWQTICGFLLMVNSNCGHITYHLRDIF